MGVAQRLPRFRLNREIQQVLNASIVSRKERVEDKQALTHNHRQEIARSFLVIGNVVDVVLRLRHSRLSHEILQI